MAAPKNDGISRSERVALARTLRDRGLLLREIAKKLGIGRTYTSELLSDPDGSKARARKERYRNTCLDCGGKTTHSSPSKPVLRCASCSRKHKRENRLWTRERIIEMIRRWNDLYGRPPTSTQWLEDVHGDGTSGSREWPCVGTVQREFGSWSKGLEAAGFSPRNRHQRPSARRNGTPPPVLSFAERGEGMPLLKVVQDLHAPTPQVGKSLLEVVRELPERS